MTKVRPLTNSWFVAVTKVCTLCEGKPFLVKGVHPKTDVREETCPVCKGLGRIPSYGFRRNN